MSLRTIADLKRPKLRMRFFERRKEGVLIYTPLGQQFVCSPGVFSVVSTFLADQNHLVRLRDSIVVCKKAIPSEWRGTEATLFETFVTAKPHFEESLVWFSKPPPWFEDFGGVIIETFGGHDPRGFLVCLRSEGEALVKSYFERMALGEAGEKIVSSSFFHE